MQRAIDPRLDKILDELAAEGGERAAQASLLRDALRADPLFVMLAESNRDVVTSMRAVAKEVPAAIREGNSSVRDEVRASNRNVLIVVIICLVLMAGLVGTSIVITTSGDLRVNETPSAEEPR